MDDIALYLALALVALVCGYALGILGATLSQGCGLC